MSKTEQESTALEIEKYLNDPEHQLLNSLMAQIRCPEKRRRIFETFDSVARTPDRIEKIRANVLAAGR